MTRFHYIYSAAGLEHQHTHRAPHAHSTAHTESAVAAIIPPNHLNQDLEDKIQREVVTTAAQALSVGHEGEEGEGHLQTLLGLSLLLGFIFMLLVDQIGGGHSHSPSSSGISMTLVLLDRTLEKGHLESPLILGKSVFI